MKHFAKAILAASVALSLGGCVDKQVEPQIDDHDLIAGERLERARLAQTGFKRHDMPFVAATTFEEPEPRPAFLQRQVMLKTQIPTDLKYYANRLSLQIGKPIRIGQDIYTIDSEVGSGVNGTQPMTTTTTVADQVQEAVAESLTSIQSPLRMKERLNLQGSAEDALNVLASTFNVHWKWDQDQITIYKMDTKTFRLGLLMTETLKVSYQGAESSGEATGGMSTTSESSFAGGKYEDYLASVESMLSPYGEAKVLPSTGTIVITDTPEKLGAIERFINDENKSILKQVALDVEVITVSSKDGSDIGLVWNNIIADIGNITLNGTSNQPSYNSDTTGRFTLGVTNGALAGSSAIIQALATKAKVSVVTRETRTVLNNTPAQFRDISVIEYPSEVEIVSEEGVTTVSTTKDTIMPGFDMSVLPRITDDNRVILNVVTSMSRNSRFDELKTDSYTQKFANMTIKELKTTQVIRDTDTAMLTGYISSNLNTLQEGTGSVNNWLLGGGSSTGKNRDMLIIFVTPHVIKG